MESVATTWNPVRFLKNVYIRSWACGTAIVIDRTHAGKRGKTASVLRFSGDVQHHKPEGAKLAQDLLQRLQEYPNEVTFAYVDDDLQRFHAPHLNCSVQFDTMNAYDVPQEPIELHKPGHYLLTANNEDGITLLDESDNMNQPAEITISQRQRPAKAYAIAKTCLQRINNEAQSFEQAAAILRENNAKLHYYCRMD